MKILFENMNSIKNILFAGLTFSHLSEITQSYFLHSFFLSSLSSADSLSFF